jgi:hypothetical protein
MLYRSAYREGLTKEEGQLLRMLRSRGFAVAIFPPVDVGHALNRKPIEDRMVRAGRETIKQMKEIQ